MLEDATMFVGMREEEIVRLAQLGNERALTYLLGTYKETVRLKANAYFLAGGDWEDVVQEGMIGLFLAIRNYNGSRNTSFRTFATLCVTRQIITAVKSATRQKHIPLNHYVSLSGDENREYIESGDKRRTLNPEQIVLDREFRERIGRECGRFLSELETKALSCQLQGMGNAEIARRLGRSTKSIDNARQRARKKLEKLQAEQADL